VRDPHVRRAGRWIDELYHQRDVVVFVEV